MLQWVLNNGGHLTRIDCALDDRAACVSLATIRHAIEGGQCVTRADQMQHIASQSIHKQTVSGETIYLGSPYSQTFLRIYDKRLELQSKAREDWQEYGIRWELELKKDRAQLCGQALTALEESDWIEFMVGVLRSYVDFRDTQRDEEEEYRYRAPLLGWWEQLTNGFRKAQLVVDKEPQTLAKIKGWVTKSLAPMLAVVCVAEPDGQAWLNRQINAGVDRWKDRHRRLLQTRPGNEHKAKPGLNESNGS